MQLKLEIHISISSVVRIKEHVIRAPCVVPEIERNTSHISSRAHLYNIQEVSQDNEGQLAK